MECVSLVVAWEQLVQEVVGVKVVGHEVVVRIPNWEAKGLVPVSGESLGIPELDVTGKESDRLWV